MNIAGGIATRKKDQAARLQQMLCEEIRAEVSHPAIAAHLEHLIRAFDASDLQRLRRRLLASQTGSEPPDLRDILVEIQCGRIRASATPGVPTMAFYFPTAAYRSNVGQLPARLRAAGNTVLTLIGEVCNDRYERESPVFFAGNIGGREISWKLEGIDMIVFPHIAWNLPASAKRVYFPHDMHDAVDWTIAREDGSIDEALLERLILSVDYILLALRYDIERVAKLILESKQKHRIRKPIVLIPGGYPKLDRNLEYLSQHPREPRSIIYALTVSTEGRSPDGQLRPLLRGPGHRGGPRGLPGARVHLSPSPAHDRPSAGARYPGSDMLDIRGSSSTPPPISTWSITHVPH